MTSRPRASLRLRLTIAFAAGMGVVLTALGVFLHLTMGATLLESVDLDLRSRAQLILPDLGTEDLLPAVSGRNLGIDPDEAFAQLLDPSGRIVDTTPAVARAPMVDSATLRRTSGPTFVTRKVVGVDDPARLLVLPVRIRGTALRLVLGAPLGDRAEALSNLLLLLLIGGGGALALSSWAGWVVAGAALRPVERMRREAAAISESDVESRLAVPDTRELARLAETLNEMLARLQEALQREHRFVDDASHELRTPLATVKAELDLALTRPRTAADMEAAIRSASVQTDRLVRLAEDLLVLARTRGGRLPVRRVAVSLRDMLEDSVAPFRDGTASSGALIEVDAPDESVYVDPDRIRQALQNLLENAVRHGGSSPIRVAAIKEYGTLRVSVEDRGPGFPAELLVGSVFDRGNLANGARRMGLGLPIVNAVAKSHGGRATARNIEGGGARVEFIVKVPAQTG